MILKERIHSLLSKLSILSKLIVLPTRKAFPSADPETSIACDAQLPNKVAGELLTDRWLARDNFHAIETEQAEFRSQPEVATGTLGN